MKQIYYRLWPLVDTFLVSEILMFVNFPLIKKISISQDGRIKVAGFFFLSFFLSSVIFFLHSFLCWASAASRAILESYSKGHFLVVDRAFRCWAGFLFLWAQDLGCVHSAVVAPGLSSTGSVIVGPVLSCFATAGSSQTRGRTHVSSTGGRFLTTEPAGKPSRFFKHRVC